MEWKRFALLAVIVAAAGIVGGAASAWIFRAGEARADKGAAPAKVLQAERIELVDRAGKPSAWLEVDDNGNPGLYLYKGGCIVASFGLVGEGKPRIDLGDNCYPRAVLSLDGNGNPRLVLSDKEGKPRVNMGIAGDGSPALSFRERDGKVAWSAPAAAP